MEFVGERRIRDLNRDHRGKDQVTDVLSFPLEDFDDGPEAMGRGAAAAKPARRACSATWSICARQALRQARADGLPEAFELAVLLVHGTLHLLGHDHETDAGQMALRQAEVLELVSWEGLLVTPPR